MARSTRPAAALIRVGIAFAGVAAVMAALGVLSIAGTIRGGVALGAFTLAGAAGGAGIAGYFFWGFHWLNERPERLRQAEQESSVKSALQRAPDEPAV